jgi:hypothetical protein
MIYHDNVDRIRDNRWRQCESGVNNCLETGGGHLQEVGCGGMDGIGLAQDRDRVAGNFECGNEPSGSIKRGEFLV